MEAQADAMVSSGLAAVGYQYINLDDFYYTYPALNPRTVGMNVDAYGRWVTDPVAFPAGPNGEDGMKVLADYIHSKGLKFGILSLIHISEPTRLGMISYAVFC